MIEVANQFLKDLNLELPTLCAIQRNGKYAIGVIIDELVRDSVESSDIDFSRGTQSGQNSSLVKLRKI
ncbi:hypothetical protein IA64_17190 [Xanthomonas arboricola pv. celebensis]|nr:hypothetical protein IA64_17190 [Xanthomonas arboricola pv. celebensis]